MTKKNIIIEPDPILRKKCERIENIDNSVRKLMDDMLETMYDAPGIGLAAIQVGILKRIVVIDISKDLCKHRNYVDYHLKFEDSILIFFLYQVEQLVFHLNKFFVLM